MNDLKTIICNSKNISEALRKLNKKHNGSMYKWFKNVVKESNLDISHFSSKSQIAKMMFENGGFKKIENKNLFCENSSNDRSLIRRRIVNENLIPYKCNFCYNNGNWYGKAIPLILDHINGISNDHRLENLRWLCPNCNSTLDTHCKGYKGLINNRIIKKFPSNRNLNILKRIHLRKVNRPPLDTLLKEVNDIGFVKVGEKYGVSDNSIRKWIKTYEKYKI